MSNRCGAPVDVERSVARNPCTRDKGHVGPCEHLCMATERDGRVCRLRWPHHGECVFTTVAPRASGPRCCFVPLGGENTWEPCTRELSHEGPCAHAMTPIAQTRAALAEPRALTLEEIDRRNEARFAQLAATITDSMHALGQVALDTQRLAGEQAAELEREARAAPLAQLRERLVAGCYQIRLRAACEGMDTGPYGGPAKAGHLAWDSEHLARLARTDADAVLAVLNPNADTEKT